MKMSVSQVGVIEMLKQGFVVWHIRPIVVWRKDSVRSLGDKKWVWLPFDSAI